MDRKQSEENAKTAAQIERFKQTARELGCDEDEAAFDEKLKALAKQKMKAKEESPGKGGPLGGFANEF